MRGTSNIFVHRCLLLIFSKKKKKKLPSLWTKRCAAILPLLSSSLVPLAKYVVILAGWERQAADDLDRGVFNKYYAVEYN